MKPLSLKWRVSIAVAIAMAAIITATCAMVFSEMREQLVHQMDRSLRSTVSSCAAVLNEPDSGADAQQLASISGVGLRRIPGFYRVWTDAGGQDLYSGGLGKQRPQLLRAIKSISPSPGPNLHAVNVALGSNDFRVLWTVLPTRYGPTNIMAGQSLHSMNEELDQLLRTVSIVGGAMAAVSVGLMFLLVHWGLRPIGATAQRLVGVTAQNVAKVDLADQPAPSELQPFVRAVRDMLARLSKAMDRQKAFVSDASHEMRTPLASAKSTVQLALRQDRDASTYRAALQDTLTDLRRMEHLADELLILAKMDEIAQIDQAAEVDLALLLQALAERFAPQAAAKGGEIVCSAESAVVQGNAHLLERLFGNLIDNAIKHGPPGGQVAVKAEPGDGKDFIVTIHDSGGAIPPEILPRMFDRFFRADQSRSQATPGVGLGLAIARQIALRHGGDISISSNPKDGTTACVRLKAFLADIK